MNVISEIQTEKWIEVLDKFQYFDNSTSPGKRLSVTSNFIRCIKDNNLLTGFEWKSWKKGAEYFNGKNSMAPASIYHCRKLLTYFSHAFIEESIHIEDPVTFRNLQQLIQSLAGLLNIEIHPFRIFIPAKVQGIILGTFPPPRFSQKTLLPEDVNFYYGNRDNYFWETIDKIHSLNFSWGNSKAAVEERQKLLNTHKLGMCDLIYLSRRKKPGSDFEQDIEILKYRDIFTLLDEHPGIHTIYFTSKKVEHSFTQYLIQNEIQNQVISKQAPVHKKFKISNNREILTITLYSPSPNAARRGVTPEKRFEQYKKYLFQK